MPITATTRCTKPAVGSSAKCTLGRRRSLVWSTRPATETISKKSAAPVSSLASARSTEAEVIQLAREGDRSAFECLYRSHGRRVYALCQRMVGDPTEAEDLTQEVFLLLFRKVHTFRGDSAFSTWLHRLTVNLVLMRLRKKSPPSVSIEAAPDSDDGAALQSTDIGAPDLSLEGSIDRLNLARCIAQLPVGYRTMFILHDVQGYEHHEIAKILGRSAGDSKSQLHKARARLRELLHEIQRGKAREQRLAAAKMTSRSSEGLLVHYEQKEIRLTDHNKERARLEGERAWEQQRKH